MIVVDLKEDTLMRKKTNLVKMGAILLRAVVVLAVMIVPAEFVSGQPEPLMIFWDEKPSCGISNIPIDRGKIKCGRKKTDEFEFYTIEHNGLTIRSAFLIFKTRAKAVVF